MKVVILSERPPHRWINVRHLSFLDYFSSLEDLDLRPLSFRLSRRGLAKRLLSKALIRLVRPDVCWLFHPSYVKYAKPYPCIVDYDDPLSQVDPSYADVERKCFVDYGAKVVVPTEHLKKHLVERVGVPETLVRVLDTPIDLDAFTPSPLPSRPVVGYVGAVVDSGLAAGLLSIMEGVWRERPDAELRVVGEVTSDADALLSPHVKAGRVKLLGFVPFRNLNAAVQGMRVCLQPKELSGRRSAKVLVYMACARPIVGLKSLGMELVEEAGAGTLYERLPDASEAIIKLLGDDDLAKSMGDRGRRYVEERHDLRKLGYEYVKLMAQVAGWSS